jgi:hypothetical protein
VKSFILECKALLIILIIANITIIQAKEYYGPKKKVVVEDFYVNLKRAYPQSGKIFTSKLKSTLSNTNRFVVKESKEVKKSKSLTQLVIRGKILRCHEEAVIKWYDWALPIRFRGPKVTKAHIVVEVDLCDPNTGVIIRSFRVKGGAKLSGEKLAGLGSNKKGKLNSTWKSSALAISINKVIKKIIDIIIEEMDKYKWEAKITKVNGNKVYIDCGLECNIKAGTILAVHNQNSLNPDTIVGKTKIIEVNKDFSIGIITKNYGIRPNMIVRMVE